jgi:hypothetical protein
MKTSVPDERPTRTVHGLHGTLELYVELSPEHAKRGEQLRGLRCELHLTLQKAAALLGLSIVDLSECERGVRDFSIEEASTLLRKGCGR